MLLAWRVLRVQGTDFLISRNPHGVGSRDGSHDPSPSAVSLGYLSPVTNVCHVLALKDSVPPSRSVVSRTRIMPSLPTSTHAPPLLPLYDDLRQSIVSLPSGLWPVTHWPAVLRLSL